MRASERLTGWRAGRAATVGLVTADALVLASIAWHASSSGWRMIGDPAATVLRGRDVLSADTPLLGMPSGFSAWSNAADPFHPAPVPLWLLAPTKLLGAGEGVVLTISFLVLVASTILIAAAARRAAGWWAAAGAVIAAAALQLTVVSAPLWTTIPPVLALVPALALCFVAWVVIDGKTAWWPTMIVVGALVAGADLAYATVVIPLVALAAARTIRDERRARARSAPSTISRRTAITTAVAVVITCAPPLLDAVVNGGGNVGELLAAAGAGVPVAGLDRALEGLRHIVFPDALDFAQRAWLNHPIGVPLVLGLTVFSAYRLGVRGRRLAGVAIGCIIVWNLVNTPIAPVLLATALVGGLLGLALVGFRAQRPATLPLLAVAATTVAGALLGQFQAPAAAPASPQYLYPIHVASTILWFSVVLLASRGATVLLARRSAPEPHPLAGLPRLVPMALGVVLLVVLAATARSEQDLYLQPTAKGLGTAAAQVGDELPDGAYRWQQLGGPDVTATSHGMVLRLIPHGIIPHVGPADAKYYGDGRTLDGSERGTLYLTLGSGPAPVDGAREVARWTPPTAIDAAVLAALADRIRARGVVVGPAANSGQLGSLALGFGGITAPEGAVIDDDYTHDLGERLRDDAGALDSLPDEAIIELADQGLVDNSWLTPSDRDTIQSIQDAYPITVWHVPGESAG